MSEEQKDEGKACMVLEEGVQRGSGCGPWDGWFHVYPTESHIPR